MEKPDRPADPARPKTAHGSSPRIRPGGPQHRWIEVKVQCKQTISPIGGPTVQALLGAVAEGEKALFVSLGGYTRDAEFLDRSKHALRLLRGTDLIDLLLRHYESLDDGWRQRIPMRRVYAVDVVSGSD